MEEYRFGSLGAGVQLLQHGFRYHSRSSCIKHVEISIQSHYTALQKKCKMNFLQMHPCPGFLLRRGRKARDISQSFHFYKFANLSAWPSYAILFSGRWANLNQEVTVHGQAQHRSHGAGCPADHHLSPQKQDLVFRDHRVLRPELPAPLCRLALDLFSGVA